MRRFQSDSLDLGASDLALSTTIELVIGIVVCLCSKGLWRFSRGKGWGMMSERLRDYGTTGELTLD